jgi:uncharacterized protein
VTSEAHNLCSPDLDSTAARAVRELILQIAAVGRRVGLWLLLDDLFGFVPPGMLGQASRFRQGEALVAGGFVPAPSIIKFRDRIT